MNGLIYNSRSSKTKIKQLIDFLSEGNTSKDLELYIIENFLFLCLRIFNPKYSFIHLFNPTYFESSIVKSLNYAFRKKLIYTFEEDISLERISKFLYKATLLTEREEVLKYFKINANKPLDVIFLKPFIENPAYVSSGAKQLSLKKEILFVFDSTKKAKTHSVIEMMKYLPSEIFLTCVDDNDNPDYIKDLKFIAENIRVDSRVRILSTNEYDFLSNLNDLFMLIFFEKDTSRFDMACLALSQGLIVLSDTSFNQEDIKGWFRIESNTPKALAKIITDINDSFIEIDAKKALKFLSKEKKADSLLDFYLSL